MPDQLHRSASDNAHWREIVLLRRKLVSLKAQTRLLRHELARKYNPDQPRVPAGSAGGGQWTSGGGGGDPTLTGTDWLGDLGNALATALSFSDVVADTSSEENWAFYQDAARPDGSLAERAIVNRDGSTIQSEFAEPGRRSDWDERHTVTLPEGGKTTFETSDRSQTIRDGRPNGQVVSRSTWSERGPEREATVQEARNPSRPGGPALAETTITSALTLFNWLSARNKLDGLQAVLGFNAGDYAPSPDAIDLSFVGQLREDEVDRACPRFQEVRSRTDAAVDAVGPRNSYRSAAEFGTAVHSNLKWQVENLGDPNFRAERSFLKSQYEGKPDEAPYGSLNSLRIDVYEKRHNGIVCVYDIKTGKAGLSPERAAEIAGTVYKRFTGVRRIVVTEIRPTR
ncbi:hypothetical protein B6S44_14145 [Bosea sp. Tri-44]|uniref:hypothetical protein n=1 Tax=Bosea sp. Tri-44 TaxID=1972137 RepID=UPI00101006E8|nr:hypothetical protein [Bosea sp. Tri-44]RXT54751.1 hypothetical protein B6S44_14145 [Bosea sp. Tri-44]